ncbi:hypothetical protein GPECTOR_22g902 [Gonium pectorale]|uniref:Uncharacterized protein n=1 Tax=Gonium pectorale TaxID=33097 RepID=A0A150GHI8_GONPE|nr:hypothetical protein GPECTOR_22g902 [Gonium pectorale]|eukprot:KXZ49308.1 hypothetical protein GPECTOR_22g902 [Gonium pectorale]
MATGGGIGPNAPETAAAGGAAGGDDAAKAARLAELEAELEKIQQQIDTAPTYGMNARALLLRAAELVAAREEARPVGAAKPAAPPDPASVLISAVKPLADAVPVPERPFVTYVPRSAIPRLVRQEAAHALTGGYLALALLAARVPEARAVQAVSSEPELRKAAAAAAGQHEQALYRQVTSKLAYEELARKVRWAGGSRSKAERERLQLPDQLVQRLNRTYGSPAPGNAGGGGGGGSAAAAAATHSSSALTSGIASTVAGPAAAAQPQPQPPEDRSAPYGGLFGSDSESDLGELDYSSSESEREGGAAQDAGEEGEVRPEAAPATAAAGPEEGEVLTFIHATLEPLYRAGLLGKEPYKRVAAKSTEKLLAAHPDDCVADFLVREHAQVSKFIMKMVEREREVEQQIHQQQQQQQQLLAPQCPQQQQQQAQQGQQPSRQAAAH